MNHDSYLGFNFNPWSFSLLKIWLKAVLVPINRHFSVVESVINVSNNKLRSYFKHPINLVLNDTDKPYLKIIKNNSPEETVPLKFPEISLDSSGMVLTRPDSFMPNIDCIKTEKA